MILREDGKRFYYAKDFKCVGFFVGQVSQLWVIKDLIEKRLNDMGETGVEVRVSK